MPEGIINIEFDPSEIGQAIGFISELSAQIRTSKYITPMLEYIHGEMAAAFDRFMANLSATNHAAYHHVYEWDHVGDENYQLWKNELQGRGANRIATFSWVESTVPVPITDYASSKGVNQQYVFAWKAPVMEYDTHITIPANTGAGVSAFTRDDDHGLKYVIGGVTIQNPGGKAVKGAFTQAYVAWWADGGAAELFSTVLNKTIATPFAEIPIGNRVRRKSATLQAAITQGSFDARTWLDEQSLRYRELQQALENNHH